MVKLMPGLESLGVKASYGKGSAHYELSSAFNTQPSLRAISKDACKRGCLDNLTVSIKGVAEGEGILKHDVQRLLEEAKKMQKNGGKRTLSEHSWPVKAICKGVAYGGLITGLAVGYVVGADAAADIAQNSPDILSPLAGLVQFGAGALGAGMGATVGGIVGFFASTPALMIDEAIQRKDNPVERYERLERALAE